VGHAGVVAGLFALGTLLHEAGHGLVAIFFGARVVRLNVLGVQIYPSLAWDFQMGCFGRVWWQGQLTSGQRAWVLLAGNLATMAVSFVALLVLLWRQFRGLTRTALLTLSFFFLDTLAHTLPTFGLPMYVLFGRRDVESISEGYLAAMSLGVPGWAFQMAVVGYAMLAVVLVGRRAAVRFCFSRRRDKESVDTARSELHR
jgi:hypothetical protein